MDDSSLPFDSSAEVTKLEHRYTEVSPYEKGCADMIENKQNVQLVQTYADTYGIDVSATRASLLLRHLDLLVDANEKVNLTRIVDPQDAIVRHVIDSLLFLPTVDDCVDPTARFVDIGTGGGFPGIPLAIMRDLRGTLIDSVGKKTKCVAHFLQKLELDCRIVAESIRAEDLARRESQSFDLVVARAVAQLAALVEYAAPLLKMSGMLIVSKANISNEEIQSGERVADITGLRIVSRETYELPNDAGHREVIALKKIRPSRVKLPRTNGAAVHKPLA